MVGQKVMTLQPGFWDTSCSRVVMATAIQELSLGSWLPWVFRLLRGILLSVSEYLFPGSRGIFFTLICPQSPPFTPSLWFPAGQDNMLRIQYGSQENYRSEQTIIYGARTF